MVWGLDFIVHKKQIFVLVSSKCAQDAESRSNRLVRARGASLSLRFTVRLTLSMV